jgi:Domain of unknown function (DUF4760)
MPEPTQDDAQLIVQLATLWTQLDGIRASGWIWSDAFVADPDEYKQKYPSGTTEHGYVSTTAGWFETVGTLVKNGLLNEALVLDWVSVEPIWKRLEPLLLAERDEHDEPRLYENFEALARARVTA